jgi:diguanylate cyclase (GGDEF)-like protein/PAS domain S-box-containing protein
MRKADGWMKEGKDTCLPIMYNAMLEGYALLEIIRNAEGELCDYAILEINRQFETITGLPGSKVIGKTIRQVLSAVDEAWDQFSKNMPRSEETVQFEFLLEYLDKHFLFSSFNPSDNRTVILFTEITLQKKAYEAFRIHEVLFENAHDIILYIKNDGQIVNANKRACEEYGYTREQLTSMRIQDIRHPFTRPDYEQQMMQADKEGIVFECIHMRSDGTSFPVEVSAKSTYTEKGHFRIHIIRNITQRKLNEEKIAWLARYDALTGISNRASVIMFLEDEIQRSMRSGTRFAIMLFDIDKFKSINDQYGHEAGDLVLRQVSEKVRQVLRGTDQIGRLGGDEFVVLQTGIQNEEDIIALVRRLQAAANEAVIYKETPIHITLSIGISLYPEHAAETNGLLHCADKAMYQVKHKGGGGFSLYQP